MPALPLSWRRLHTPAEDTRITDARQWEQSIEVVQRAVRRVPELASRAIRGSDEAQAAAALQRRQDVDACTNGYIAACYQGLNAGPAPGAVVGIVLGAILGFLLLIWVLWTLSNGSSFIRTSRLEEEEVVVNDRHRHRRDRSSHRSSHREEMRQTLQQQTTPPRRDRIVRQERISRDIPRDVSRSRVRETIIVDESRPERRVEGDDVIEVIAEGSDMTSQAPPPRRKSGRRSSGYRSVPRDRSPSLSIDEERIESGYRRVDPNRFAGGGYRQHEI